MSKHLGQMAEQILCSKNGKSYLQITDDILICCGDSLRKLKALPDNSIDCVVTDPPYFIDGMSNKWDLSDLERKTSKAGVVQSLPVGMKFDKNQGIELQQFMSKISAEIYRVLKPGGFYLSFSQGRLYHRMAVAIEDCGFEIRDLLVWKREGQGKAFSQDHFVKKMNISEEEKSAIIDALGGRKTPQLKTQSEPIVLAQKPKEGTFIENWLEYGVGLIDVTASLDGKFPGTIMCVEKPKGEERLFAHMTLKPVRLMEHLIKIFSREDAVILDPFMGSGTTGIAAQNTGRSFIGIELNKKYFNMAKDRLRGVVCDRKY